MTDGSSGMVENPEPEGPRHEETIRYRPMGPSDVDGVPTDCHGSRDALVERIDDLGAAAILAFDGPQHVGQLQFRRYRKEQRSANGIWHADYWGDFGANAPELPHATLAIHCYHVGQLTDGEERDARYFGRGIGLALLDELITWAGDRGFEAIVAKHTPQDRAVMGFMGGQPASAYEERGFEIFSSWVDEQLDETVRERKLVENDAAADAVARVGLCIRRFRLRRS